MTGKTVEKDPAVKVARQRPSVLEMAETLGNTSEACRRSGMDRTNFYEWKASFPDPRLGGAEGYATNPEIPAQSDNAGK